MALMYLIFNLIAVLEIALFVLCGLLVFGIEGAFLSPRGLKLIEPVAVILTVGPVLALDIWLRSRHREESKWFLLHPEHGGQVFLVPVWLPCAFVIVLSFFA